MNDNLKIGKYLRSQRELQNLSCKVISQKTKIHMTNLERLESDDFENLPCKAYLIGYIKSYADALNIDPKKCLDLFNQAYDLFDSSQEEDQENPLDLIDKNRENNDKLTTKQDDLRNKISINSEYFSKIAIGVALVIIVSIFLFFSRKHNSNQTQLNTQDKLSSPLVTPNQLESISKPTIITERNEPTEKNPIEKIKEIPEFKKENIPKKNIELKAVQTNTQPVKLSIPKPKQEIKISLSNDKLKKEKELKKLKESKESEMIQFTPFNYPIYTINKSLSSEEIINLMSPRFKVPLQDGIQVVLVSAKRGDSWITYKSDKNSIKKFVLRKGRSVLIKGKLIKMFIGNHHNINIFLNNQLLVLTSPSSVKSIVFPQSSAKNNNIKIPLFKFKDGQVDLAQEKKEVIPSI